ncbi:hypothetical protein E8E13_006709 [Curvularia kusanoi]|uniref:Uncharacterized protein n=1 Tax=Curvularia kusanoi TaxID=90978 RepID=A0A9P4TNC3_CURKU|nr:hypothetical protein E8E13_006709 [Curvularia kusanoi]
MIDKIITTIWLYAASVLSSPLPARSFSPWKTNGHVQCASIDTYTVDWFLRSAWQQNNVALPLHNALFYTRHMSNKAKDYACAHDLVTIWNIWDEYLYNHRDEPSNALRCIHNDKTKRHRFFESMSEAYARLAVGTVVVMHDAKDWAHPPSDGIWHQVEYETIVGATEAVMTILKVREKEDVSARLMWDRDLSFSLGLERPISAVLAIGRYVPDFLVRALTWESGPFDSARQVVLNGRAQPKTQIKRQACRRVPDYPYEVY